jgi:hypothetical protein
LSFLNASNSFSCCFKISSDKRKAFAICIYLHLLSRKSTALIWSQTRLSRSFLCSVS